MLNEHPFLTITTNGKDEEKEKKRIIMVKIINYCSVAVFAISVLLFLISFLFFYFMEYKILMPIFFWTILALFLLTVIGFTYHTIIICIKKKKKFLKRIDFVILALCITVFLSYELAIFSIPQTIEKSLRKFWETHKGDESILEVEKSLKCCGFDKMEPRCIKVSEPYCYNVLNKKYMKQQYPICFTQMAFAVTLFVHFMLIFTTSIRKAKRKHHHHHKKAQDEEKEQREMPLSPDQL